MAYNPVGSGGVVTIGGAGAKNGEKFAHQSDTLRVYALDTSAHVTVGSTVTAATTDFYVAKNTEAVINIGRPSSQRVVAITKGNTTTLDFPEGTGCPFIVGQKVSLTISGGAATQQNLAFTEKAIASINNTAGVDGYFGTRVVITYDSSSVSESFTAPYAELRDTIVVGAIRGASDTGSLYYQQVQVSGDA